MNYPFFFFSFFSPFRPCYFEKDGTGEKKIQVKKKKRKKRGERARRRKNREERRKEKQARKLFPRGKRETVEIENIGLFASRVHIRLYTKERETNVTRRSS